MIRNSNHNPVYILTTITVYLGLVFVGASPQALGYAQTTENTQPHIFEINVKTNSVFSKLRFETDAEREVVLPFAIFGADRKPVYRGNWNRGFAETQKSDIEINARNNQVLMVTNFPRASI